MTANSATLRETVNANYLSTTAWYEYGLVSGSYGSKSETQSLTGSTDTTVTATLTGLSSGKTYYFRIAAQNSAGTTYGKEKFFTTLDTTAPLNSSITINSGEAYTKSTSVTLALSATDDIGITGYYLSTGITAPLISTAGWTSMTSTPNYNANVSYTLTTTDAVKTLYCWYKDAANNISISSTDSITLDSTAPIVTITSPTTSATYSTITSTLNLSGTSS